MSLTNAMLVKVEAAIERNQLALRAAVNAEKWRVAELCGVHHFRLRAVSEYLYERLGR